MLKHKPLYSQVLKKAWDVSWRNKPLWVFGFLAGFLQTSGVIEIISRAGLRVSEQGWSPLLFVQNAYPGSVFIGTLSLFRESATDGAVLVLLIMLGIVIALLWFFSGSEAALIGAVAGKTKKLPRLFKLFRNGKGFAWPVLGVHVVSKLLLAVLFLATSLPIILIAQASTTTNIIISFIAFLVFFPLVLIVSFLTIYTIAAIVIQKSKVLHAVHTAWDIFKNHWIVSLETAVILFAVNLLAGLILVLFALLLVFPVTILGISAAIAGMTGLLTAIFTIALILIVLAAIFLGAFVSTFQLATWTILFQRLSREGGLAVILRVIRTVPKFFYNIFR